MRFKSLSRTSKCVWRGGDIGNMAQQSTCMQKYSASILEPPFSKWFPVDVTSSPSALAHHFIANKMTP